MENNNSLNDIFNKNRHHIILLILIIYVFNFNVGLMMSIIYILLYLLNDGKIKYDKFIDNKIADEINENPLNEIKYNNCRPATINNPYANYLIGDQNLMVNACTDQNNISKSHEYNMLNVYENAHDINIGSNNKALRNFYTNTVTSYPVDTIKFAKYLYKDDEKLTCKIHNNCLRYDDIRYQSR